MAPKHALQSLTINASLLGLLASGGAVASSPAFWGKAANCADEFNAPGLAAGLREIIPVVTGMSAIGAIAGRFKAGNVAFWTPKGVIGPNREDFEREEINVPIELTEIKAHAELSNKAVGHLVDVVQGLQSRLDKVPVVDDIRGIVDDSVRAGKQVMLEPVPMGEERQPDRVIDIARNKLMELI
ncbi:MAG: hypothetical protein ACRC62_03755 [Microcoleus sp.]